MHVLSLLVFISVVIASASFVAAGNDGNCGDNEFWYDQRGCCLPNGGPNQQPSPPSGRDCPNDWYWQSDEGCCVPRHGDNHNHDCNNDWHWDEGEECCRPNNPEPSSGHYYQKRTVTGRSSGLCPANLNACPIPGARPGSYECLDTANELESCGGCASTGDGQDCTAIKGAWNVACEEGSCVVYTCQAGYQLSQDGKTCNA